MSKHPQSIDSQVTKRVLKRGMGWVFTPKHFLDLGGRRAVDLALYQLKASGTIRQLARGLYDYRWKCSGRREVGNGAGSGWQWALEFSFREVR